ncbi:MAG TPA: hypothetical protein VFW71_05840 [Actinomycetota bacterium]|nr:hypothetical protein [Actinomycetota bacterium]
MSDAEIAAVLREVTPALARGSLPPAVFVIPAGSRRWTAACADLVAAGDNDLGIPPRAFAYAAIGMLAAALGAEACWVADPAMSAGPERTPDAVVVTCFARGRLEVHVHPYVRAAGGDLRWGEPSVQASGDPGGLGMTLPLWRAMNREPAPLPPAGQLLEDLADSGFVLSVDG